MATIEWANDVSGQFNDGSNWVGGVAPGGYDNAILDAAGGKPYVVTAADAVVGTFSTAANARLNFQVVFEVNNGTGDGVNAGTIYGQLSRGEGGIFELGGAEFDNSGAVRGSYNFFQIDTQLTVTGGGIISLNGTGSQRAIEGSNGTARELDNVDNRFAFSGDVATYLLTFDNEAAGLITNIGTAATDFDLVDSTLINAGIVRGVGAGGMTLTGDIENDWRIRALNGALDVTGNVTGTGVATITDGTLTIGGTCEQNVVFLTSTPTGELALADSQGFSGQVRDFSPTGATTLDLQDIGFVSADEASFAKGVLTVSDGTHTATIRMSGAFTGDAFTCASDGNGGTLVTAGPAADAPATRLTQAIAAFAGPSGPAHIAPAATTSQIAPLIAGGHG